MQRAEVKGKRKKTGFGVRSLVQWMFAALSVLSGLQFYRWVRYIESGANGLAVSRPAGVEAWLPIVGLMQAKFVAMTGRVVDVHPAAFFLFIAFVSISLVLKKTFCSWVCPLGLLSEKLWQVGHSLLGRNLRLTKWVDLPLRGVKYLLLGFFLFAVATMNSGMIEQFLHGEYGLIVDVKMLMFFRELSGTGIAVLSALVLSSMVVKNLWCRYACPYGALMGLVSMMSSVKIRRDTEACVACGKCSKVCPSSLPVAELVQVRSPECTGCLDCISICRVPNALQFSLPPRSSGKAESRWVGRKLRPWMAAAVVAGIFMGVVGFAKVMGHWKTKTPDAAYVQLVREPKKVEHPGF